MTKSPLNLSIATPVKYAAIRAFAGKQRGEQLSDFVQAALVRICVKRGELSPLQFIPEKKARK